LLALILDASSIVDLIKEVPAMGSVAANPTFSLDYCLLTPRTGAEVLDIDLSAPLDDTVIHEIEQLLVNYGVVFFRDQHLSREQHRDLGKRFGALHIHPAAKAPEGFPELIVIHADAELKGTADFGWHTDVSCDIEPPAASMLYMRTVPAVGGDTLFSNMYLAYEGLSAPMQAYLEGLTARHEGATYRNKSYKSESEGRQVPITDHPVVCTHPVSGRKALFVNSGFTTRLNGVGKREGSEVLRFLFDHVNDPRFVCRFKWQPNSIAFWDNRCVQHYPVDDYFPAIRTGDRVTIAGSRPA
jgi:taurine dioxygenase